MHKGLSSRFSIEIEIERGPVPTTHVYAVGKNILQIIRKSYIS